MSGVWYHKALTRSDTGQLLLGKAKDGSFLIRDSESVPNAFVLSVLFERHIHNYRIFREQDGRLYMEAIPGVKKQHFEHLEHLVTFYSHCDRGLPCQLKHPVICDQGNEEDYSDKDEEERQRSPLRCTSLQSSKPPALPPKPRVHQSTSTGPARGPRKNCEYMQACRVYLESLKLSDVFFDSHHDKCYCTKCHASRNEKLFYTQGEPAKDYALPIGWTRFGLKMSHAALALHANTKWHVAYHGTAPSSIKSILECGGQLLIPGDIALGGKRLSEVNGHFTENKKPEDFNTKQVFVSPSIRYSGLNAYAKSELFVYPVKQRAYKAKVAFQLWIEPGSYRVGPQTVGAKDEIDPKFNNQEIEWFTVQRGAIHLYGLLVQLSQVNL